MMTFYNFAKKLVYPLFRALYGLEAHGVENVPDKGPLIVYANHQSFLDPIFLGLTIKRQISFMAKIELFRIPILSSIIKKLGAFPVNRRKADISSVKTAMKILKSGRVLGIFPEGTRSKTGRLLKAKTGFAMFAYRCKSTVLPVKIKITGRPLWFPKATVIIGKPISFSELAFADGSLKDIQRVSNRIFNILRTMPEV